MNSSQVCRALQFQNGVFCWSKCSIFAKPPLVGVPGSLLGPTQPLQVLPLPQVPILPHYQLPPQAALQPQPALQLVQQLPLAPQLVLHPQIPQTSLLLPSPVQHKVKSHLRTKVLSTTEKSLLTKATTVPSVIKSTSEAKDSRTQPGKETDKTVASGLNCDQSEKRCEDTIKLEETNGNNLKANLCTEICEKPDGELKATTENQSISVCEDSENPKIKKMKHIMILDEDKNFCIELPLENDNTLSMKVLQRQFPGICGLTYRSSECPHRQWIALDRGKLRAPKEGWNHDLYVCVFSKQSGGKWLHTFCHCSFSKPSKNKQGKSGTKSWFNKSNPSRNKVNEGAGKSAKNEDSDICVVEEDKTRSRGCSEITVYSLPQWVTDNELKNHFKKFGIVTSSTVKKDLVGAQFGIIKFKDFEAQEKALAEVFHKFGDSWCSVHLRS